MFKNRIRHLTVTRGTRAFLCRVLVYRKPRGVDPEFDKIAWSNVPLDDGWRDVEVLGILGVHVDTIHQLVVIRKLLRIELFLQRIAHFCLFHTAINPRISSVVIRRMVHLPISLSTATFHSRRLLRWDCRVLDQSPNLKQLLYTTQNKWVTGQRTEIRSPVKNHVGKQNFVSGTFCSFLHFSKNFACFLNHGISPFCVVLFHLSQSVSSMLF